MKTVLKVAGWILAGIFVLAGCAYAFIYVRSSAKLAKRYDFAVAPTPLPSDAGVIARGRHVATIRGCLDCHGEDGGGAKVIDDSLMGKIYGPNITQGRGGLLATHSDADWVRAVRHGVGANGRGLVIMPSADFSGLTEDDMGSLVAFLQSLPKVDRATVPIRLGPLGRLIVATRPLAVEEIDHARVEPAQVVPAVSVAYGRYLAVGCVTCHGPNYSGGKIDVGPPDWPPAANLTPGGATGGWTEADFIKTLRTAHRPDGTELNPVMPRIFGQMTDLELKAIWTFLQTLPPAATGKR